MQLTLKSTLVTVLLVMALLVVLVGGIVRIEAAMAPLPGHHSGMQFRGCPAPPVDC